MITVDEAKKLTGLSLTDERKLEIENCISLKITQRAKSGFSFCTVDDLMRNFSSTEREYLEFIISKNGFRFNAGSPTCTISW